MPSWISRIACWMLGNERRWLPICSTRLMLAHRLDQQLALVGIVAARFLQIDMLAGGQGQDGHRRVPMVRRRDGHRVQRLVFQRLAEVLERPSAPSSAASWRSLCPWRWPGRPRRRYKPSRRPASWSGIDVGQAAAVGADDGHGEFVIGPLSWRMASARRRCAVEPRWLANPGRGRLPACLRKSRRLRNARRLM